MPGRYSLFAKRFFLLLNSLVALLFLIVCLTPYINVSHWWAVSALFLLLVLFIFFWAIVAPRYIFLSLVVLALGYKSIAVFFATNPPATFHYKKAPGTLRVVSWNVARFLELKRNSNVASRKRLQMFDLIRQQDADVLCFQEFFTSTDSVLYDNIGTIKALGYPYYYFCWDEDGDQQWFGQIIFSRHPIIDSGLLRYPPPAQPETMIHADILFGSDTVRIYTTHLQSVKFRSEDYEHIEEITRAAFLEN